MYNGGSKWEKVGDYMFIGQYNHALDEKNRLTIPSKFRDKLGFNAVMTIGFDQCIAIYPASEWETFNERLNNLNTDKAAVRQYVRVFLGNASECECDSHGRVIIPPNLKKSGGIEKEVVLIGLSNHIEIWAKDKWVAYEQEASMSIDEIAEQLSSAQ